MQSTLITSCGRLRSLLHLIKKHLTLQLPTLSTKGQGGLHFIHTVGRVA